MERMLGYDDVLLVPVRSRVYSRKLVDTSTRLTKRLSLKLPIVSANMDTITEAQMAIAMAQCGGIGIVHRFMTIDAQVREVGTVKARGGLLVGAAIGVKEDYLERAEILHHAGADVIILDIAHGHSEYAINAVKAIKAKLDVELVAGNVATREGARDLIQAGADAIKVGIGPGSVCVTRKVTGVGVPQFSAVQECAEVAMEYGVPVIADGGICLSGDIVKALAAGASSVMVGGLFAGCTETPGDIVEKDGEKFKRYRGMASKGAAEKKLKLDGLYLGQQVVPEGIETIVPLKGSVKDVLFQLLGGLRSGMSYMDAFTLEDLRNNAQFIRVGD